MKTKKNRTNDEVTRPAEEIADLSVTDEQAEQAKGGPTVNFQKIEYSYGEQRA